MNKILNKKLLNENYTMKNILLEESIVNNQNLSFDKKYNNLRNIARKGFIKSSDYSNDYSYKKVVPKELKKYHKMNAVTTIIYNGVGTKR